MIWFGLGIGVLAFIYYWNAPIEDEYDNIVWKAVQKIKKAVGK